MGIGRIQGVIRKHMMRSFAHIGQSFHIEVNAGTMWAASMIKDTMEGHGAAAPNCNI
jgi:hypothetical protein